jgi:hypothetical protein
MNVETRQWLPLVMDDPASWGRSLAGRAVNPGDLLELESVNGGAQGMFVRYELIALGWLPFVEIQLRTNAGILRYDDSMRFAWPL